MPMNLRVLERFAAAFPEPILLVTNDGRVHGANPAAVKAYQLPQPLPADYFLGQLVNDSAEELRRYLHCCARSQEPVPSQLHPKATPRSDKALPVEGSMISPATTSEPAVILLRGRTQAANDSGFVNQKWLRVTLENIGDAVIATDLQGGVVFMNSIAERLTGWTQAEAVGRQPLSEIFHIVHERTGKAAEDLCQQVIRTGHVTAWASHTALIDRSGQQRPIDSSAIPVRDEAERLLGTALVFHDITKQRQTELELRELNAALELRAVQLRALAAQLTQAEQSERKHLAQLLHDHLQQILVAARLNLNALRNKTGELIPIQSLSIIDELICEAIEASRSLTMELSPPVLHEDSLLSSLLWLARWMEERHGLHVQVNTNGSDTEINEAEISEHIRVLLFQAARELLFNIVKHAGVDQAFIRLEQQASRVMLEVMDQGIGFDTDAATHGRLDQFGLFSIGERMEACGGKIEITSVSRQGTRIRLSAPLQLPVTKTQAQHLERALQSSGTAVQVPVTLSKSNENKIRILLADADASMRHALRNLFSKQLDMVLVAEAANGVMAVEMARQLRPDVIIIDISTALLDGIEATRLIMRELPAVRVIGFSSRPAASATQEAGAADCLSKSNRLDELIVAIRGDQPTMAWGPRPAALQHVISRGSGSGGDFP